MTAPPVRHPPLRGTGTCNRCHAHTNDGIVVLIEQATGVGATVLYCADRALCDKRRERTK